MIPVLYEGNEREFVSQGLGSLKDAISCTVSEELNGSYELKMEYPVFGEHFSEIKLGRLILAEPAPQRETEPFSIYKISKPTNGIVTINAEHISYRLSYVPVKPFSASSCTSALNGLVSNAIEECPFTVWTDKSVEAAFNLSIPQSFRLCLGGIEGSILDTYKGEYEFNRFNVKLHAHRGSLKDSAKIIYGRNLIDLTQEETIEKTVTGIIPYWKGSTTVSNSDDTTTTTEKLVMLPEYVIKSEYSGKYPYERTIVYDFSSDFQDEPTIDELRKRCEQYMEDNVTGVPDVSLTINFANLSGFEENKGIADQIIYLGDSVPVLFDKYDISTTAKIVSVEYDTLEERYNTITLGSTSASLSKSISQLDKKQTETITKSDLEMSLILAQKILAGGEGGYIVTKYVNGHPSERVIGDTDDIKTMVNCFRFNKNGIGVSNNGFNGPYISAWTIDGGFNASFINTGVLTANLIKAGILSNKDGSFWVNFDTNEFYLAGMAKKDDLNAIQIGGRNLARWTYSDWSKWYSEFSGIQNTCVPVSNQVLTKGLKVGDTVIFKMEYKYQNIVAASGQKAECWLQGSGNVTAWNAGAFPGSSRCELSGSGTHTFEGTFTINADHLKNDYWSLNIRHDYVQSGSISYRMLKVEKGTKATDWSPAPEDLESYADSASQNAVNALDQTAIFNKLTNNGQTQGLALVDGKLYLNAEYLVSKTIKGLTIEGGTVRGVTVEGSKVVFGGENSQYRISAEYNESNQAIGDSYKPKGVLFKAYDPNASALFETNRFFVSHQGNRSLQMLSLIKGVYSMITSFGETTGLQASVYASVSSGNPHAIMRSIKDNKLNALTVDNNGMGFNCNSSRFWNIDNDGYFRLKSGTAELMTIVSSDDGVVTLHAKSRFNINAGIVAINGYKAVRDNSPGNHEIYLRWTGSSLVARVDSTDVWSTSDRRLKDKIASISDDYVDAIGSVEMKEFIFTDPIYDRSIKHFGVIAQDVRESLEGKGINPEEIAVNSHFDRNGEEYYTIDKDEFLMARVAYDEKLIKQQAETISKLEERLNRLEELMNANNQS